ncbi:MAG: alpha/beta fold hydrolase [Bdellovibrionota bacterium]
MRDQSSKRNASEFVPKLYVRNRHLQSVISPLTRSFKDLPESKDIVMEQANGLVLRGKLWQQKKPSKLAILWHGLGGKKDSPYVVGAALALYKAGFCTLRMDLRGAQDNSPYIYHGGVIEDFDPIIEHVRNLYSDIYCVGYSLSANMLLRWLSSPKDIRGAFVVSPPVRLRVGAKNLDRPENLIYRKYFLEKLEQTLRNKAVHHPELFEPFLSPAVFSSIEAFDSLFSVPFHGFASLQEFYEHASSYHLLGNIQTPVCLLHSRDDPFLDHRDIEDFEKIAPDHFEIRLHNYGGHTGFYHGLKHGYVADQWIVEYFQSLEHDSSKS